MLGAVAGLLCDLGHGLAAADELAGAGLHDLDLVAADLAEVDLVHVGHS